MRELPEGWKPGRLGDSLTRIDAGWSPACPEHAPTVGQWGVLKVSAVSSGTFRPQESKVLPGNLMPRPELRVANGDILVVRANGVAELVGAAAEARDPIGLLMLPDKTLRLVPDERRLAKGFLLRLLQLSETRKQVQATISGSSGQKNLSQEQIRGLKVSLPPPEEQEKIAAILDTLDEAIRQTEAIVAKLKQMKQGLLHDLLTRGLDEHGELRDPESGTPRSSKTPPSVASRRFGRLSRFINCASRVPSAPDSRRSTTIRTAA